MRLFLLALASSAIISAHAHGAQSNLDNAYDALERADYRLARAQSEMAIVSEPANPNAYVSLGRAHMGLDRFYAAMKYFNIALDLDPANRTALMYRGRSELATGNHDAANKTLARLQENCGRSCLEYVKLKGLMAKAQ